MCAVYKEDIIVVVFVFVVYLPESRTLPCVIDIHIDYDKLITMIL